MNQLAFDITLPPNYTEEDFLVAKSNHSAWAALQQWDNQRESIALIRGPKSCGKTHLAHIWANRNNGRIIDGESLKAEISPEAFFQHTAAIVIDDCENMVNESMLFHLLNFTKNHPHFRVLLTAKQSACWDGFTLPDLRSRMQALAQTQINEPDDTLLTALMVKSFQDKQIEISLSSLGYLLPRIERSFDGLKRIIDALDKHAIAKKKPITRSLIQEVLTQT